MRSHPVPIDCQEVTEKYQTEKGGICGQACLAIIEETTIKDIMLEWDKLGFEWTGWSTWKQLQEYLERKEYIVRRRRNNIVLNKNYLYIARVQFIGKGGKIDKPFYGWNHWTEATSHTHFITIGGNYAFFCNSQCAWLPIKELSEYLNCEGVFECDDLKGVITSYLEIEEKEVNL
jgi:hypothetical protein